MRSYHQFYIDGQWVSPVQGGTPVEVINPATEEIAGTIRLADADDVERAVSAAHRAFATYSCTTLEQRIELISSIAQVYEQRLDDLAMAISEEMGAPLHTVARPMQAPLGLWHLRTALALARDYPFKKQQGNTLIVKEPVGVCALITPWNWPMNQIMCKVAPALLAGCTMVLKPSELAPFSPQILCEILEAAGVPAGVFNMIHGDGALIGPMLSSHPLIDMVSLTGSTRAGVSVAKQAADTVKVVSLELGGKSANIILDDAPLAQAVTDGVLGMMRNTGQSCNAPSRMLVPAAKLAAAEQIAAAAVLKLVVGDPQSPSTTTGPVSNARQYERVQTMIQAGIDEGARVVVGGCGRPDGLTRGYFARPTVFSGAKNTMRIAQEEIFGPVLTMIPYASEEEAIAIANDTVYGLSGFVYGGTIEHARAVAERLRTGMVHLNGASVDPGAPFGGYKQSGVGRGVPLASMSSSRPRPLWAVRHELRTPGCAALMGTSEHGNTQNHRRYGVNDYASSTDTMARRVRCIIVCGLWLVFLTAICTGPRLLAQAGSATGTIRGTVFDPQGAAVGHATVTVTSPSTGGVRTVETSPDGAYQVQSLNPGTYTIQVDAPGFEKLIARQLEVSVGQFVVYDAHLRVGASTSVVEVLGSSAPLIDVDQTQQANTINERQQENLPNISRNFAAQVFTLPGVVDSNAPSVQDPAIGTGYQSSGFSFGGGNGRSNLFTIDGGQNDAGSGAPRVPHVPQDSVQEFQVNRNAFGPEFGYTTGSAINVITKSGTNSYHGKAFEYFHDQRTDSANYFNSFGPTAGSKPFEQSEIFGGSLGGPIKSNKLFFFTSYERQKLDSSVVVNLLQTQAAQGLAGQSNGYNGSSCPAPVTQLCYFTQLANSGDPTLMAVGAGSLASPVFSPLEDPIYRALISPNSGTFDGNAAGGAVQAAPNQNGRYNNWVTRADYQPNSTNNFSLRFSLSRESNQVLGAGGVPRFTSVLQQNRDYTITGDWNHTFNANLVNTVRVQVVPFSSSDNRTPHGGAEFDLGSLGVQGTPFDFPYNQSQNQYQFDDDLSLTKGRHNLKFGESYRPVQYDIFQAFLFGGEYQYFDGAVSFIVLQAPTIQRRLAAFNLTHGYSLTGPATTNLSASQLYVAGLPLVLLQGSGQGQYNATTQPVGFYGQDSWKVTHTLTLDYGARFDIYHEPASYPTTYFGSPRFGAAWDPRGNGRTVLRAGGGLFVAPLPFIIPFTSTVLGGAGDHIFASAVTAPGSTRQLIGAGRTERSIATPANPNPALTLEQLSAVGIDVVRPGPDQHNGAFFSVSPRFKSPYSVQASASVAQQLAQNLSLELGYIFYHGVHIQQIQEGNFVRDTDLPVDPFVGPYYVPRPGSTFGTPNSQIIQNDETTSDGSSSYNGLTASLTKRYGHGLQFQANYTFSKAIDNTSDFSSQSTPFRPDLLRLDRGLSDFDIRHSFVANAVYTSPRYHAGGGLASLLYSDFVIAPIVSVRTGVPFTLLVPGIASNGITAHPNEARPFREARNLGSGPGFSTWDMRISRGIPLKRESPLRLDLIAQSTNILNHTNFTSVQNIFPNTAVTDATGLTTSALVQTREGTVDLLNGPYGYKGFRPHGPSELTSPLAFKTASTPRQISFGVEFAF